MPVRRPQRFTSRPGRGALAAERFCARCGARDVPLERHHWAPRAVFEDADNWPLSYLCRTCHDDWHRKMGWRPRVKTLGDARKRRKRQITRLREEISDALFRADFSARMAHSCYLLGLVNRWWKPFDPLDQSVADMLSGEAGTAGRERVSEYFHQMEEQASEYQSVVTSCVDELIRVGGAAR